MAANEVSAHFCVKCGAPLSSFATIAPFERLFAEGFIYRQAAEHPRKLIVVLGIWLIFGAIALGGMFLIALSRDNLVFGLIGVLMLAFSMVMIWKTTRNYLAGNKLKRVMTNQSVET